MIRSLRCVERFAQPRLRLVGKALQPEDAGHQSRRRHVWTKLKGGIGRVAGTSRYPLDVLHMAPREPLIAQKVMSQGKDSVAEHNERLIAGRPSDCLISRRSRERLPIVATAALNGPQTPQGLQAQPISASLV